MAELVTIAHSDSVLDGGGTSSTLQPPQVDNASDDAILIKVTQSLNSSSAVAAINVTTPTGYTLLVDVRDSELRSWVFYKRSTGNESIPNVSSDTASNWTCTTAIVTDVDWLNGGVAQQVNNTSNGDHQSPDLTTQATGSASAIVCFYSVERRANLGFRYPQTRPQTRYEGAVTTGTGEGVDNTSAAGYDYIADRSTLWEGPFWEANGGGDSVAINVEVVTQNNVIPLQQASLVIQSAPASTFQTTMDWCREIIDSGKDLDGGTPTTWTFDASSDVDPSTDEITITGHGMDESMVLYFSDGGNTAPGGMSDDTFYFAFPQDANTIKLCTVNEDSDDVTDYYYSVTTQRPIVDITSAGSGVVTFTEARMMNNGANVLDITRPANGDPSNPGPAPGDYIGDAGYNQNFVATAQRFNSAADLSSETLTFEIQINSQGRLDRVLATLIDDDGDWINWKIYQNGISARSTGQTRYQIQPGESDVQALAHASAGTFDATAVRYLVINGRGSNSSTARFNAINSQISQVQLGGPFTVINGQESTLAELVDLAATYTDTITQPSDLQVTSLIPIAFGDGVSDVSFVDSEKSIAFPPLADGVNTFINYLASLGVTVNATRDSTFNLTNSQIGASVPYPFEITAAGGSDIDVTGNSYVFATANLDPNVIYNRQLFVGGQGIQDNFSAIRNSTFIVNDQIGAGKGMLAPSGQPDIESCTFELASGATAAHAFRLTTPGTYTFTDLAFNGFGADGTNTAAVLNDSTGAIVINVFGGDTPTVKNGAGASTTVNNLTVLTLTGLQPNTEIRVFTAGTTTEIAGVENSGSSFTANISESSVDIVIHALGYVYQRLTSVDTSADLTLPVQQIADRNYENP